MARARTIHRCTGCGEWNTLVEEVEERAAGAGTDRRRAAGERDRPVPILEVDAAEWSARPTGIGELDRVLGGGLVPGSVTLIGGEPGIGKSTLLLQAMASLASQGSRCLLVSAEESAQQVRMRAARLNALESRLWTVSETILPSIRAGLAEVNPDYLVIDSIQ